MKCFPCPYPSHSPTPSHTAMPIMAIVTGNANDTQLPSLCWLPNTQCNFPMGNPSRVNPDSYHSTLGLGDKPDRVFSLGQQNFSDSTAGLSHPCKTFSDSTAGLLHHSSLLHLFRSFTPIRSLTPMQDLSDNTMGLLHPSSKNSQYTLIISHFII